MSPITTHVVDTSDGIPAAGVRVSLEFSLGVDEWEIIGTGITNGDGRVPGLVAPDRKLSQGVYRLSYNVGVYFGERGKTSLYPAIQVLVELSDPGRHYHLPVLCSPWGYTTYRGS